MDLDSGCRVGWSSDGCLPYWALLLVRWASLLCRVSRWKVVRRKKVLPVDRDKDTASPAWKIVGV